MWSHLIPAPYRKYVSSDGGVAVAIYIWARQRAPERAYNSTGLKGRVGNAGKNGLSDKAIGVAITGEGTAHNG